jgi:acyl-CoA thioesterase-1
VILIIIAVLVVIEFIALSLLYISVGKYKGFWESKANETGEITYLALGDSAAQGIGATSPMRGYVGIIAKRLEQKTGKKVRIVNLSETGAKMSDYLETQAPKIAEIEPDYVTIEIGANDIPGFDESKYRAEFKSVLESLPKGAYVSNMPLFNSRPSSTKPAKQASEVIAGELQKYPDLKFVDLQKQTEENQSIFGFAPDLFHPNNLSYKNWADAFWLKIESEL